MNITRRDRNVPAIYHIKENKIDNNAIKFILQDKKRDYLGFTGVVFFFTGELKLFLYYNSAKTRHSLIDLDASHMILLLRFFLLLLCIIIQSRRRIPASYKY